VTRRTVPKRMNPRSSLSRGRRGHRRTCKKVNGHRRGTSRLRRPSSILRGGSSKKGKGKKPVLPEEEESISPISKILSLTRSTMEEPEENRARKEKTLPLSCSKKKKVRKEEGEGQPVIR